MLGKIKKLVPERGFGFVTAGDGKDYFFHRSTLSQGTYLEDLGGGHIPCVRAFHKRARVARQKTSCSSRRSWCGDSMLKKDLTQWRPPETKDPAGPTSRVSCFIGVSPRGAQAGSVGGR